MTPTTDAGDDDAIGPDAAEMNRYAGFESGDDLVVYDRKNESAWLQSDGHVDLDAWR